MRLVRRVVRGLAGGWLAVQLSALVASPVALCLLPDRVSAAVDGDCCPGAGPGHVCPMRRSKNSAGACRMTSACGAPDEAILSLSGGVAGILPAPPGAWHSFAVSGLILSPAATLIARPAFPESPPPRG